MQLAFVLVPLDVAKRLGDYLRGRPYGEVADVLDRLERCATIAHDAALPWEQPAPAQATAPGAPGDAATSILEQLAVAAASSVPGQEPEP